MSGVLANDSLSLGVDARGRLASLVNCRTGCEYLQAPGLDLWRLVYRHPDDPETPVDAAAQPAVSVTAGASRLSLHYPHLTDREGRALAAAVTVEIELRGEELVFTAAIENRASHVLTEFWFPMLGGLGSLGARGDACFLLYPESAGRRIRDPLRNLADRNAQPVRGVRFNFLRHFYPGAASMQWLGLYGEQGSLYIGSHDTSLQTTALNAMLNVADALAGDSLSLGFIKYPFVKPGERWRSAPFVVAVHDGSWHADARRYRAFADTWQDHRRERPDWVRDMPAMQDVIMLHQYGRVNYRYDQIADIAKAAAAGGIDTIKLTGWSHGGHDNRYPDFEPSPALGGEDALVDNLRAVQAGGARTVLYFHFVQMSPNSEFYRRHGEFCALKDPNGNPFVDIFTWPSQGTVLLMNARTPLINACTATGPWQEQVLDCVRRGLAWGVDCVFLDQTAGAPSSWMCFDERHGHPTPALACGPGKTRLSEQARALVRQAGPDKALGAEYLADAILQYYDFTIPFGMGFFHGGQHFGELYRYTFPEDVVLTQYMSREDYDQLHYSFVMGYRFFLAPRQQCAVLTDLDPAFVRRLADLVCLRRRHAAVLLRGRFLDTEPLELRNPQLVARAYEGVAESAIAVWNPTAEPQELAVSWPGRRCLGVDLPGRTGGSSESVASLAPGEVAVMRVGA